MESLKSQRADLFDPASLAALGRIEIVARWIVDGFMSGLHRSPRKGFLRRVRRVSPLSAWRRPALHRLEDRRALRPLGRRQYEEETNLRASVVLDVSRSMAWSGVRLRIGRDAATPDRLTKLAYAEQLTAALALLLSPAARRRRPRPLRRSHSQRASPARAQRTVAPHRRRARGAGTGKASERARRAAAGRAAHQPARADRADFRPAHGHAGGRERDARSARRRTRRHGAPRHGSRRARLAVERRSAVRRSRDRSRRARRRSPTCASAYRNTVEEVIGEWRSMFGSLGIGYEVVSTDAPFGVPLRRAFAARQQLP